ncbi:MAG: AbrB/MazE/SpoVT family DNA-binding domain-containing protein [Acidaminococcaceae bacterium]|nr:AbrB/MazE/SpoVT family DNA-binding domain-containing protein [Acidaminococcaceae bacterium]MBP3812845.1 AbrB/MazE/SpoVT family DNA-binding domain-containing protein [Acidaminococcaceae bacterium]MBQ5344631.1 AbrB/MazE/SpoVT family DNA-binding domain-containing protein [Acidaminococcaceae bacterium]
METAKIFSNGGSQAVRLPKQYRFNSEEVLINRIGNIVMLIPKDDQWENTLKSLDMFTDDFLADPIEPLPLENREAIL